MTKKPKQLGDTCKYCGSIMLPLTYSHIKWCKQDNIYKMIKEILELLKDA